MVERYDVIVIGGGHAGTEAAALASRAGARTLLLTQNLETIGQMSCNPAIGGIAKGTVVREVDALGGIMGRATDLARIQFRMLNRSKGPAVWSPRAQCDRGLYRRAVRSLLERRQNLDLVQGTVAGLVLESGAVRGVETQDGRRYLARAVVLTAGTFLRGVIHLGLDTQVPAGRAGDTPAVELAQVIERLGVTVERFKTGTPPRIDGRSVDFACLERQDGDARPYWFSAYERARHPGQLPCWLTWTTEQFHDIIASHLNQSALYGGAIAGRGPRYCPSIEDKIVKFPDAPRHQVFLEPEGLDTSEMYVNGLSTSLPPEVQLAFLRGCAWARARADDSAWLRDRVRLLPSDAAQSDARTEGATGTVPGWPGERYDWLRGGGRPGRDCWTQRGRVSPGARTHRHRPRTRRSSVCWSDDLVSRGVDEPYRLFTSRSEYRLLLRQDNALRRLLPLAERLGLLDDGERRVAADRLGAEQLVLEHARGTTIDPQRANVVLRQAGSTEVSEAVRISDLTRRPGVPLTRLLEASGTVVTEDQCHWAEVELKYAGYLQREQESVRRLSGMEEFPLPADLHYGALHTLSFEAREKLDRVRPASLGQASRIPGVTPSDLHNLVAEVLAAAKLPKGVSRETRG